MAKILMIAPTPFFADRGCHTQIYEEIKALQKLDHEIVLCTYGLGRDVPGIEIKRCFNFPWYKKLSAGPSVLKIFLLPFLTLTVLKNIWSFKPEIIHCHLHEGAFIGYCSRLFNWKKKFLFDMQGSLTGELLQHKFVRKRSMRYGFFAFMERKIVNWFPVITQSDSMVEEVKRLLPGKEIDVTNVKDGVDTDIFKPMDFDEDLGKELGIDVSKPRVLFMGLLEEYQGVDVMFKAFSQVVDKVPEVQLLIIGYPNLEKYQKMAEELKIREQTKFLGRIEYQQLPRYLSLSSVAVAPKIAETEGDGKIYNYMAMGMATVAFDREVSREILGDTGFFCELGDGKALAEKICYALKSEKEAVAKGKLARKRAVENLSWDAVGKRIDAVYKRIL